MHSHVIPVKLDSGVWDINTKKGFKNFLNQRAEKLLNRISHQAGVKKNQLFEMFEDIRRV